MQMFPKGANHSTFNCYKCLRKKQRIRPYDRNAKVEKDGEGHEAMQ
jgi:hypothetical protein